MEVVLTRLIKLGLYLATPGASFFPEKDKGAPNILGGKIRHGTDPVQGLKDIKRHKNGWRASEVIASDELDSYCVT